MTLLHGKKITLAWISILITALISTLIVYWSFEPFGKDIIELKTPMIPMQETVNAGEIVVLQYTFCKNKGAISGVVNRYLKNSVVIFLPQVNTNVPVGCSTYNLPVEIPAFAPTGVFTYNAEVTYHVNPIKTLTYYFQSEPFNVIGKDK